MREWPQASRLVEDLGSLSLTSAGERESGNDTQLGSCMEVAAMAVIDSPLRHLPSSRGESARDSSTPEAEKTLERHSMRRTLSETPCMEPAILYEEEPTQQQEQ